MDAISFPPQKGIFTFSETRQQPYADTWFMYRRLNRGSVRTGVLRVLSRIQSTECNQAREHYTSDILLAPATICILVQNGIVATNRVVNRAEWTPALNRYNFDSSFWWRNNLLASRNLNQGRKYPEILVTPILSRMQQRGKEQFLLRYEIALLATHQKGAKRKTFYGSKSP